MLSVKQEEFLRGDLKRINLLYGSVRSGKSWISLLKWGLWVGEQPENQEFIMVGKTITTLKRNCLNLLSELVGTKNFVYSVSQKKAFLFGRTVWLEGANDERAEHKIRGMTLKGAYVDELTLIPESFYNMLLSRLSEKDAKLIATTNPDNPNHYVKKEIIDNDNIDCKCVKFLIDDNDYLDKDYVMNLKKEYKGVFYDRFILGEFVRAQGLCYPEFVNNPERYLIDDIEKYIMDNRLKITKTLFGLDYGPAGNGNACICAIVLGDYIYNYKEIIIVDEYLVSDRNLDPKVLQDNLMEFIKKNTDKYTGAELYADYAVAILTTGLRNRCIVERVRCMVNDCIKHKIIDRISTTNKLFAQERLKIQRECRYTIDAFKDSIWKEDSKQDERLKDTNSILHNIEDAWEYSICNDVENIDSTGYLN